ncbi:Uncharacterised protein [Mycobacteroides abscessus subsp. abscessus]|nr:Uncharacterised protein [Mycobacteroides abscessus subsp. abscessus]
MMTKIGMKLSKSNVGLVKTILVSFKSYAADDM